MDVRKKYCATIGLIIIISVLPFALMISHQINFSVFLSFVLYGVLSLISTANLTCYLAFSYKNKNILGKFRKRALYIVVNILVLSFNIAQVLLIHLAF